jgi:hypothetical protein
VSDSYRVDTKARPEFDPALPHFPTPSFMLHIAAQPPAELSHHEQQRVQVLNIGVVQMLKVCITFYSSMYHPVLRYYKARLLCS